jgi:hypothetical protein
MLIARGAHSTKLKRKVGKHPDGFANGICIDFIDQLSRQLVSASMSLLRSHAWSFCSVQCGLLLMMNSLQATRYDV